MTLSAMLKVIAKLMEHGQVQCQLVVSKMILNVFEIIICFRKKEISVDRISVLRH